MVVDTQAPGLEMGAARPPKVSPAPPDTPAPASRAGGAVVVVLLIGLAVTAAVAWTASTLNDRNESRLLDRQTQQVGTVLTAAIPSTQIPLVTAAQIAQATSGNVSKFEQYMSPYVEAKGQFVAASLWQRSGAGVRQLAAVGPPPELGPASTSTSSFVMQAYKSATFVVSPILGANPPHIGFAYAVPGGTGGYAVYAERAIPADRQSAVAKNSAFSDLHYAFYLGRSERAANLLTTDFPRLPVTGNSDKVVVPFGSSALTVVTAAAGPLGGTLPQELPWIFGVLGVVITVAAAWTAGRLVYRRRRAERDTAEILQLYGQQRSIAETLQHALLPRETPDIPGLELAVRYVPGVGGVDIGGDWYSVIAVDDEHFVFVVGDVSGRGISAASVMARLRFTIRAYALEGYSPSEILEKCSSQLSVLADGHFATILVGVADVTSREITLANAGHFNPLVIDGQHTDFVATSVGLPIGLSGGTYDATTATVPSRSTMIAFTDGLIERRGESIDVGLQRLQDATRGDHSSLEDLLTKVITLVGDDASEDDIAILGMRWLS